MDSATIHHHSATLAPPFCNPAVHHPIPSLHVHYSRACYTRVLNVLLIFEEISFAMCKGLPGRDIPTGLLIKGSGIYEGIKS